MEKCGICGLEMSPDKVYCDEMDESFDGESCKNPNCIDRKCRNCGKKLSDNDYARRYKYCEACRLNAQSEL